MPKEVSGLLKVRVHRGINLAVRDTRTSDPYLIVKSGIQKVRTKIVRDSVNPVWNDELTIHVKDPRSPVTIIVMDKDTFTDDDNMGDASIDIRPLIVCMRMGLEDIEDGSILERIHPTDENCLVEDSCIVWNKGKITQEMKLKLREVETGVVELEIQWNDLPGDVGIHI